MNLRGAARSRALLHGVKVERLVYDDPGPARQSWDEWFLDLAHLMARRSKDPSTQVGAVIADGKRIVSQGYNGFPTGVADTPERLNDRDVKLQITLHAELNAVLTAARPLDGCTIYVTRPPCAACAAVIVQVGIKRVVYPEPPEEFVERWKDSLTLAHDMMAEAGVRWDWGKER